MERKGTYPSDRRSTPAGYITEEYPYRESSTREPRSSSRFSDVSREISIERKSKLLHIYTFHNCVIIRSKSNVISSIRKLLQFIRSRTFVFIKKDLGIILAKIQNNENVIDRRDEAISTFKRMKLK